jgi:hypothetical protein
MSVSDKVIKGWYVEGERTEGGVAVKIRSRVFHAKSAADAYAELFRAATDLPNSVNVRTKIGFDKLGGGRGDAAA